MAARSRSGRAIGAVLLLVGFYLLAFGIVAAMIGANYALYQAGRVSGQLAIGTFVITFAILRAVFFVRGGFKPPPDGVLISDADHPELFHIIDGIAADMGTSRPDEVYLIPDVNAYVVEDTLLLGLISRKRILAVGVGLLNVMTVDEIRAVVAHEFGHYAGSDTRLGAIAYRGWESIVRALQGMADGVIRSIFVWYAKIYLKATSASSRQQEIAADRWAAQLGGSAAAARALSRLPQAAMAYSLLLNRYVEPMATQGVLPADFFEGLRALMADPARGRELSEQLADHAETSEYDTHPPVPERVAAIDALPPIPHTDDPRPARGLLRDPSVTERALTAGMFVQNRSWKYVEWEDAGNHLATAVGDLGDKVLTAVHLPGDLGKSDLWELLRGRDLHTFHTRLGGPPPRADDDLAANLRPFVEAVVVRGIGDDAGWAVDWSGPAIVATSDHDVRAMTDQLLAGGDAAAAAQKQLADLR